MKKTGGKIKRKLIWDIKYTYRRFSVDSFYLKVAPTWNRNSICIDVGGKKTHKKGDFIIENYINNPIYVNIDPKVTPDIVCDACNMPFQNDYADILICSEMIEHVEEPVEVIKEMYRVLKPGGKIFICVPFSMHIHGLPCDYGRYTEVWWQSQIERIGFSNIEIARQGGYYATRLNMNKRYFKIMRRRHRRNPLLIFPYMYYVVCNSVLLFLENHGADNSEVGYTTGYEIILTK